MTKRQKTKLAALVYELEKLERRFFALRDRVRRESEREMINDAAYTLDELRARLCEVC